MKALGLTAPLAAAVAGVSAATVRRWAAQERSGQPLRMRRGPQRDGRALDAAAACEVRRLTRSLHGLAGAEALRQAVKGKVSRREAAALKHDELRAVERERVAEATRVEVTTPGVMRGFDQLWVPADGEQRCCLVAGDTAVPFRTSATVAERYDGRAVAEALERDFDRHGAPLVLRDDRARSHDAPEVREVLRAHQVLVLHGPPHCPRYYGQTERQNREHRAWLDAAGSLAALELPGALEQMVVVLNAEWRRPTLGWRTAAEVWHGRPELTVDRNALHEEVKEMTARIGRHLDVRGAPADLAERLAIEQALINRGFLKLEKGGWC
jgi:hypothetical protein